MEDILGMLLPLLMSGAGLGSILRVLLGGGVQGGAAGNDGLSAAISESFRNAMRSYPYVPDQKTVTTASEMLVDRIGVVPTSGFGHGLTSLFNGLYKLSPDTFGSVLGVPNGNNFFGMIANGASGISRASGYGDTDLLNPYSVMDSHRRAMGLAKTVYGLGVREGGGYDVNYTHGLNMDEFGKVSQRILSSDIPYVDEYGKRLDPESDAFKEKMKKFGSKINEAVSSLTKVTGSIDETLTLMDRMAGGNFLGGSEEQASETANKARKVAAAIRITAAASGTSPTEIYANMKGLQGGIAAAMGVSPNIANASGFSNALMGMAYNGTMAYNYFNATHPNATQDQKNLVEFAAKSRTQAYGGSEGATLSATVADNADRFTSDQLRKIREALRSGRPNDATGIVRKALGERLYDEYMNNPATRIAARRRASEQNGELLNDLDAAGIEGNLPQAEQNGARKLLRKTIYGISDKIKDATGNADTEDIVKNSVSSFLKRTAIEHGLSEKSAEGMNNEQLRKYLSENGMDAAALDKAENSERVRVVKDRLDGLAMSDDEEADARSRLMEEMSSSGVVSKEKAEELSDMLRNGSDINEVFSKYSSAIGDSSKASAVKRRIFGGKMTRAEVDREKAALDRIDKEQNDEYTDEERMRALRNSVGQRTLENSGTLMDSAIEASKGGGYGKFEDGAGKVGFSGREVGDAYESAARSVVESVFGDSFNGKSGDELTKLKRDVSEKMIAAIWDGKTPEQAFAIATEDFKKGKDGKRGDRDVLDDILKNDKDLTGSKAFFSAAASDLNSKRSAGHKESMDRIERFANGDFGDFSGLDAIERFAEDMKEVGAFTGSDEEFQAMVENAKRGYNETGNSADEISKMLSIVSPVGLKDRSFTGAAGSADQNVANAAYASGKAAALGLQMMPKLPEGKENIISDLDKTQADKTQNSVTNAIQSGGARFTKEAVESTKERAAELGERLVRAGIGEETLKDLSGNDNGKADAAKKLIEERALAGRSDSSYDIALIRAMSGTNIGGKDGAKVLLGGKKGVYGAGGEKGADDDYASVTKKAGREDSGIYPVMKMLGDFLNGIAPYFGNSAAPIPVAIKSCDTELRTAAS